VSGEVVVEQGAFEGHAWVNAEEIANYPCVEGIPEEISKTMAMFAPSINENRQLQPAP
jgi:hypothetical protein